MDAALFLVIMLAALAVTAVVIGRAQRKPSPDDPTPAEPTVDARADDPRDRPAGSGAELDAPHSSQFEPGETADPDRDGQDVSRPSGNTANEPREPGRGGHE